jgi:hypothetical protein
VVEIMNKLIFLIKYVCVKIVARYFPTLLKGEKIAPGIVYCKQNSAFDKIVFLLNDTSYIHLGDQYFWAPTIIAVEKSKYKLEVLLPGDMDEFWHCNGVENSQALSEDKKNTLYITDAPVVLSPEFKNRSYIAVDLGDSAIDDRVSVYLCNKICNILNITISTVPQIKLPQKLDTCLKEKIEALGDNVWLMSDSVTSCPWRFPNRKRSKIWEKVEDIVNSGGKVVYIHEENGLYYPFEGDSDMISLDLRHGTTPDDIMAILQMANVSGTLSFDNFLMHTALLCWKKPYVAFRGRYSKKQKMHCYEHVNTAFVNADAESIEYL